MDPFLIFCAVLGALLGIAADLYARRWVSRNAEVKCAANPRIHFSSACFALLLAGLFVLLGYRYGIVVQALVYGLFAAGLCTIAIIDYYTNTIPNRLILALAVLWLASVWTFGVLEDKFGVGALLAPTLGFGALAVFIDGLLGAVLVGLALLALSAVFERVSKKSSFGGGDIKLLAITGLYLGLLGNIITLFIACVCGVVFAIALRKRVFPFGPSIALASMVMLAFGPSIGGILIG
jgi:leader peptidase (prepilin peptidase)/N-methyltransferase